MPPSHPEPPPDALLAFRSGPRAGQEVEIATDAVRIGSGPQNEIVLEDDSVSREHALLERDLEGWRLTDLGSKNGTYIEGTQLAPQVPTPVAFDYFIRLGGVELQFRSKAAVGAEQTAEEAGEPSPIEVVKARTAEAGRRLAPRSGFRLPVWVLAVIIVAIAVAILLIIGWTPVDAGAAAGPLVLGPSREAGIVRWFP